MKSLGPFLAIGVTLVSVLFGSFVGVGGVKMSIFPKLYFIKLTLAPLNHPSSSLLADFLSRGINITLPESFLFKEYDVFLWSFCTRTNVSSTCTPSQNQFFFDSIKIWHLENQRLPSILVTSLDGYTKISRYVGNLYIVALVCTIATLVVGTSAMIVPKFPKNPLFPFLLSLLACVLTLIASISVTVTFSTVLGAFKTVFRGSGVHAALGRDVFVLIWISFVCSFVASGFWFLVFVV